MTPSSRSPCLWPEESRNPDACMRLRPWVYSVNIFLNSWQERWQQKKAPSASAGQELRGDSLCRATSFCFSALRIQRGCRCICCHSPPFLPIPVLEVYPQGSPLHLHSSRMAHSCNIIRDLAWSRWIFRRQCFSPTTLASSRGAIVALGSGL